MVRKESDIINNEYINETYSNDASAASFGWNFQYNAGIFLFLKYADDVTNVEIENDMQDITLQLKSGECIYAQAKSAHDYSELDVGDKTIKIKDAIISLSNTALKDSNGFFIYISNIKEPIKDEDGISKNRVVSYPNLNKSSQIHIDELFSSIKKKILKSINVIKKDKTISNSEKVLKIKKKNKDIHALEILESNKERLFISTIIPFKGDEERFDVIKEELVLFLDKLKFSRDKILLLKNKYIQFLMYKFEVDAGLNNKDKRKTMKTSELVWPISSLLIYDNCSFSEVDNYLDFLPDPSNIEVMKTYLNDEQFLYHSRFEFSNRVISEYFEYRSKFKNTGSAFESFITNKWTLFQDEFDDGRIDKENLQYLTKYYIYKLIKVRNDVDNVYKWLGKDRQ